MPRISDGRHRMPFYDTLVAEKEQGFKIPEHGHLRLFSKDSHVGDRHFTNLMTVGMLSSDETYRLDSLSVRAFFDSKDEKEVDHLFCLLIAGLIVTPQIGDHTQQNCMVDDHYHSSDKIRDLNIGYKPYLWNSGSEEDENKSRDGRLVVHARQSFLLQADFSPWLVEELNRFMGRGFIRFFWNGEMVRDVA